MLPSSRSSWLTARSLYPASQSKSPTFSRGSVKLSRVRGMLDSCPSYRIGSRMWSQSLVSLTWIVSPPFSLQMFALRSS